MFCPFTCAHDGSPLVLGNRFAERSLYGRTGQDEIDTRNEISQKTGWGSSSLIHAPNRDAQLLPLRQTDGTVARETPLWQASIQGRFRLRSKPGTRPTG